jgi:hypothetical protein
VVDQLRPKLIFPMHAKTEKCNILLEPVDSFLQGKKDVQRLNGSSFTFTQEDLKTGLGIVVLQPAL